ncbi:MULTISPECIES: hypothetical protein [unclassified Pannonibacter]|uniref:hypothetical protein n=1 Tax=unclassified Pannonibacter TaxID=2627228 RepID=UPI0016475F59|nr:MULTISPECIES: hypothetical protein [unclassified Pannonibacter]
MVRVPGETEQCFVLTFNYRLRWSPTVVEADEVCIAYSVPSKGKSPRFISWDWSRNGDVPEPLVFAEKEMRDRLRENLRRRYGPKVLMFASPALELQRRRILSARKEAERNAIAPTGIAAAPIMFRIPISRSLSAPFHGICQQLSG